MKKWIVLFLCLIPALVLADVDTFEGQTATDTWEGSSNVDTREGSTVAGGATADDVVLWLNFENDQSGDYTVGSGEYSVGDQTGTNSSIDYEETSLGACCGSWSIVTNGTNNYLDFGVTSNDIIPQSLRAAVWFDVTTWAEGVSLLNGAGTNNTLYINALGADEIRVRYKWAAGQEVTFETTDANIATGTTYCIEIKLDITGNDITIYKDGVELTDGGPSWNDSSTMSAATAWTNLYIPLGSGTHDINIGKVIISDDISRTIYTTWNATVNYP